MLAYKVKMSAHHEFAYFVALEELFAKASYSARESLSARVRQWWPNNPPDQSLWLQYYDAWDVSVNLHLIPLYVAFPIPQGGEHRDGLWIPVRIRQRLTLWCFIMGIATMETVVRTYRVRVQHGVKAGTDAREAPKAVRRVCTGFMDQNTGGRQPFVPVQIQRKYGDLRKSVVRPSVSYVRFPNPTEQY